MNFQQINILPEYNSGHSDLYEDFYRPCLESATVYDRAVGYFRSSVYLLIAPEMIAFAKRGGKIRLICSPSLTEDDFEAMQAGYSSREALFEKRLAADIESILARSELQSNLAVLATLINTGCMEVKLADPLEGNGIYHEKLGVFEDASGDRVSFKGSVNESWSGWHDRGNYESFSVFATWVDERERTRVQGHGQYFNRLWNNTIPGLTVSPLSDVSKDQLLKFAKDDLDDLDQDLYHYYREIKNDRRLLAPTGNLSSGKLQVPPTIKLRDYQEQAIASWFKNNGHGVLTMATGTGKTITGLAIAATLAEKGLLDALLIVCPYVHLVDQWAKEVESFGVEPILVKGARGSWEPLLNLKLLGGGNQGQLLVVISTTASFRDALRSKFADFPTKTMLLADEVHNMGAKNIRTVLPENIRFRLGLSATPERWMDEEGTAAIFAYFGDVIEPVLDLKSALQLDVLVPYYYFPILVSLTEDESDEYYELSEKIAKAFAIDSSLEDNEGLKSLLIKRARLIATAENKLPALKEIVHKEENFSAAIVYCGDGRVESTLDAQEVKQVKEVTRILGSELLLKVRQYTHETPALERIQLSKDLGSGELDALVAIRCLDEGVDIPAVGTAVIMASSTNPRQFIQRRGRILRRAPGKDSAKIYDLIVIPETSDTITEIDRRLMKSELTRFIEFADLAQNASQARQVVLELQDKYQLLDI